jgi:hypothetical protein
MPCLALSGDVAHGADHAGRRAVLAGHDEALVVDNAVGAVAVAQPVLAAEW